MFPAMAAPATAAAFFTNTFWLLPGIMADLPDRDMQSSFFASSPEEQTTEMSTPQRTGGLDIPDEAKSRSTTPTQYEFIMTTGDESATATKQKLKTVRSHVMKNYLQQQQQQRNISGDSSLSVVGGERRKGKQRARSSRSGSRETEHSPISPGYSNSISVTTEMGSLFSGFSTFNPFSGYTMGNQTNLNMRQPFALDFGYNAPQDEVSNYAQLYVTSLIRDETSGLMEPSFETLNAKGETVRILKDTLGFCGNAVPQSTVFAMSILAFGCAVDCEWDQAKGHLEALQRLIDARGGVHTVDFELQRTFTWTTYCLAGSLHLPPHFPSPQFSNVTPFPLAFLDEAQIRAWRTVKRFPKNNPFVFDVMARLQQLGLATSSEWYKDIDQRALSNLYFDSLQAVVALQIDEPWNATIASGAQGQEAVMMFKVWTAGLPLFIWATARHVRNRLGLRVTRCTYDPLFSRIRGLLEGSGGYHAWPRGKSLEPVMTTLFYCVESCDFGNPWRTWCIDTLRKVTEILKLKTVDDFRKALAVFPSTEDFNSFADELWVEMIHGSAASTPSLTFSTLH